MSWARTIALTIALTCGVAIMSSDANSTPGIFSTLSNCCSVMKLFSIHAAKRLLIELPREHSRCFLLRCCDNARSWFIELKILISIQIGQTIWKGFRRYPLLPNTIFTADLSLSNCNRNRESSAISSLHLAVHFASKNPCDRLCSSLCSPISRLSCSVITSLLRSTHFPLITGSSAAKTIQLYQTTFKLHFCTTNCNKCNIQLQLITFIFNIFNIQLYMSTIDGRAYNI